MYIQWCSGNNSPLAIQTIVHYSLYCLLFILYTKKELENRTIINNHKFLLYFGNDTYKKFDKNQQTNREKKIS
jgi:hypothetical protein